MSSRQPPVQLVNVTLPIDYKVELEHCRQFLEKYSTASEHATILVNEGGKEVQAGKYMAQLQEIADFKRTTFLIELDDIVTFPEFGTALAESIQGNAQRYLSLFYSAADAMMPKASSGLEAAQADVVSVLAAHRKARLVEKNLPPNSPEFMPNALLRRYTVCFKPLTKAKAYSVRQVKADMIGSLIRMRGIITRVTEVKPLIQVATYTCDKCGFEIYQEVNSDIFTPTTDCPSDECKRNNSKGNLWMQTRGSKFLKYQEVKLQELTEQVPMGHIPRTANVQLYEDLARSANPGDHVIISGIYLPKPYTGWQGMRAGLLTDAYLHATHVEQLKPKYSDLGGNSGELTEAVRELANDPEIYSKLARSLAPEIFGHEEVKKALLLLLVGAATKETKDGMKIRGDINICLMGDPGVAKSQLLKHVAKITPRGVYTTGKGSSGVGLTAAVQKDPVTGEMVLEGGALVLADNGICCIDEFDKMDELDRTAIHEVMEQQTISISKAGITTTLNARTSILAAANPLHGRYNTKRSVNENINLPYALLSRFDILFLILDKPSLEEDTLLAQHVTAVHRDGKPPASNSDAISPAVLRQYLAIAKQYQPNVPIALRDYIVSAYVSLRQNDLVTKDTYTTARTLLAIIRMSQALARLRFSEAVSQGDIDEAIRLIDSSRASIYLNSNGNDDNSRNRNPITRIYSLILDLAARVPSTGIKSLQMNVIREKVRVSGFNDTQLSAAIEEYEKLNVWALNENGSVLRIFN